MPANFGPLLAGAAVVLRKPNDIIKVSHAFFGNAFCRIGDLTFSGFPVLRFQPVPGLQTVGFIWIRCQA